jgi:hypothetical protein
LTRDQVEAFGREWHQVQARFVDDPDDAVMAADELVLRVLSARGYTADDIYEHNADVTALDPHVLANFRDARAMVHRRERGEASTEERRQVLVYYRALFEHLLHLDEYLAERERMTSAQPPHTSN